MSDQHTPGPWVVRDADTMCPVIDSPNVGKGYWASLATATQRDPHPREGGGISMEMARANARLISAAPDLLKALETLLASFDSEIHNEYDGTSMLAERLAEADHARAAIAKARGNT
jgi:hypothetical protein